MEFEQCLAKICPSLLDIFVKQIKSFGKSLGNFLGEFAPLKTSLDNFALAQILGGILVMNETPRS